MSTTQYLNSSQSHYSKYSIYERGDGTGTTDNMSKSCENCRLTKQQLQSQIYALKDKAHQSFMQVIQVQQLHEEEIQLMKQEHHDQIAILKQQIKKLEQYVSKTKEELLQMQKNSKHHVYEVESPSFLIENVDIIHCQDENGKQNNINESWFDNFSQLVEGRQNAFIHKHHSKSHDRNNEALEFLRKIEELNLKVQSLESQVQTLWQSNQQLKKQCTKHQNNAKTIKNNYDTLFKESKLMAEHIRTLSNQKFKLERKMKQLEKLATDKNKLEIKTSKIISENINQPNIKANGTNIPNSREQNPIISPFDNFRSEKESQEKKDPDSNKKIDSLTRIRSNMNMVKSDMYSSNEGKKLQLQIPKPSQNHKKSTNPPTQFKKFGSQSKTPTKQKNHLKSPQNEDEDEKSNFMEDIRKQMEQRVNGLKKNSDNEKQKGFPFKEGIKKRQSDR